VSSSRLSAGAYQIVRDTNEAALSSQGSGEMYKHAKVSKASDLAT